MLRWNVDPTDPGAQKESEWTSRLLFVIKSLITRDTMDALIARTVWKSSQRNDFKHLHNSSLTSIRVFQPEAKLNFRILSLLEWRVLRWCTTFALLYCNFRAAAFLCRHCKHEAKWVKNSSARSAFSLREAFMHRKLLCSYHLSNCSLYVHR